ncbi:unnamed protein product [Cylicostephanus goldi]|uniref:Uncharacterized protein n=1 Tax=Cylicostephanus goldi TaxID=71465 RepID=A0A3P7MSF5_CYLGO|nr:unnamed protein product [Cylicostephanus goldi]
MLNIGMLQEGHTPLRRSCLTTFFKWYRESYFDKKTKRWMAGALDADHLLHNGKGVKKRKKIDEQDDIVEISIESEQPTPKTEDVKSAFSPAFDKTGGIDGEQSNSAQENTTSDQPSTSGSESVKKEGCASFVDEAMEDELLDDSPHVNDFCNGVSAEDLLHMEDAFEDGKEEECPVAEFEDLTEAKTEVKEKSEDLAR